MSWLTDLAGKAEAFLDRVDQATASTLQDAGIVQNTPKSSPSQAAFSPGDTSQSVARSLSYEPTAARRSSHPSNERGQGSTVAQVIVGSASDSPLRLKPKGVRHGEAERGEHGATSSRSSPLSTRRSSDTKSVTPKVVKRESDDVLFDFLNTPSSVKTRTSKTVRSTPKVKTSSVASTGVGGHVSEQVSTLTDPLLSPVKAQPSPHAGSGEGSQWAVTHSVDIQRAKEIGRESTSGVKSEETDGHFDVKVAPLSNQQREGRDESEPVAAEKKEEKEEIPAVPESQPAPSDGLDTNQTLQSEGDKELLTEVDTLRQKVSNLELENRLLKREVASLNDEMGTLMTRLNEASDSRLHHDNEIQSLREQVSQSDHVIRQLRSHDDDLQALLEARDQQIAVLRAQLTEGDRTAEQLRANMSAAQREKEQLLQDANLSSGVQNQALESLKNKLAQAESLLHDEREKAESTRWESAQRESQLEAEKAHLSEALANQQRQVDYQQSKLAESQSAVRTAQNENQLLRKEYEDYKQRAAGILQAKEKLISSLQGGASGGANAISEAQLEEMRVEKEHVQAQLLTAQQQLELCKATMQEMEDRYHGELDSLSEQLQVCEGVLTEEKRMHSAAQQEVSKLNQELEICRDDFLQEKSSMLEQIKEKDVEVAALKSKLLTSSPDKAELESRLRELTESLIQKQTTLETLNSERHSLNLQMERMQAQLSDAQRLQTHKTDTTVVVNGLEPAAAQDTPRIRPISSVLSSLDDAPTESRLHNVKRAVNSVDRFSIRLGVFLRRYPHARLFALLYVVLLHIWVMVVLLTYTPEAHDTTDARFQT